MAFENIVGKGEIARNEQFLLFPQCFQLNQIIVSAVVHIFDIRSLIVAELTKPNIGISGKRLTFTRPDLFVKHHTPAKGLFLRKQNSFWCSGLGLKI